VKPRRFLAPETLPRPVGYSHVVDAQAGRVIYVSGQVPLNAEGHLVGEGDFEAQTRQVFENLIRAIRDEYVDTEHPPASTLVEVSGLFRDDVLIEIEAVAIRE
jgi:enamine deaminase RidA (YjgF/YER057c/UK114 family)